MQTIRIPKSVMLELTYKCNFNCKFCYCAWESEAVTYAKQDELSINDWIAVVKKLKDFGVERIGLSGGEPLMKEGVIGLMRHIRDDVSLNDMQFAMITNGSLLNEEMVSVLKEVGIGIGISLQGITTYSYHTGCQNNTPRQALLWISRLSDEGIDVHLNVTVTHQNLHELAELITAGFSAGASSLSLSRFVLGGRGYSYRDELALTDAETIEMLDVAENTLRMLKKCGSLMSKLPFCMIPSDREYRHLHLGSGKCGAARGTFAIDPSGYVRVCLQSSKRVGHIFSDNIVEDIGYWNCYANHEHTVPDMCKGCKEIYRCDCGCIEKRETI